MQGPTLIEALIHYGGIFVVLVLLVMMAWNLWLHYINTLYLRSIEWVVLEVVPPKEVFKSPLAMEIVLSSLYGGDVSNWYSKYWKGELNQYYSLEIASIEGSIHFYVRFPKKFRKGFEAQLYAQYPQAVIKEVEDYTKSVPNYEPGGPINVFGYNLELAKDDPFPIKSYIDFGLDRAVGSLDEEQRIDPITPILETMGSVGTGEQIWMQIIMQKESKRHVVKNDKGEEEKGKSAKDKAKAIIKQENDKLKIIDPETKKVTSVNRATKDQQQVIEAIERHMNKPGFDCGIRLVYVAKKDNFNGNTITAFTSMFRHLTSETLNTLKATAVTSGPTEPWKDLAKTQADKKKASMLKAYKARAYFFGGFDFKSMSTYFTHPAAMGKKPILLSTEELATLWHLPGRVAETPTFTRIEATKGEPPVNLPI